MAVELGVSWRTVMRDLDYLRDDEGAPLAYDPARKGYYFTSEQWSLEPVSLTEREVMALAMAARMFHPFRGTPMEADLSSLFAKVGKSVKGEVSWAHAPDDPVSFLVDDYVPLDGRRWTELLVHIRKKNKLSMRYRTFSGEEKTYEIAPVHLLAYHGNWYALAFRRGDTEPVTFALSRIRSVKGSTKPDDWSPPGFDAQAYAGTAFGISRGDRILNVHVRVSPKIASYMEERVWHPSQKMARRKDGWLDIRLETRGWKELVRWILSWQPDMKVISPISLRDRVREKLKDGLAM